MTWIKSIISLLLCFTLQNVNAQELNCNVSINSAKVQGSNKNVFTTLQATLTEFMNGTKWTEYQYTEAERIDCSLILTVKENSGSRFNVSIQIQARRPIYGSSYQSMLLNLLDDEVVFDYVEFDRVEFDSKGFRSNLSSVLAFYAYFIIGVDNDSFAIKSGTQAYERAQQVVSNAQKEAYPGWNPYENANRRNRYWLVENMLDAKQSLMRTCYYQYHRQGMDLLTTDSEKGRKAITQVLTDLKQIYDDRQDNNLYYLKIFFDAKADEIINVYLETTPEEKTKALIILQEIDPNNGTKYAKLKVN